MALLQLKAKSLNINQLYALTTVSNNAVVEKFYADLEHLTENIKKHEFTIIMGEFNAQVQVWIIFSPISIKYY